MYGMMGAIACAVVGLALAGLTWDFARYRSARRRAQRGFLRVRTRYGPIPYLDRGPMDGRVVLVVPGGGAGVDALDALSWLFDAGFRAIAVCRPGYYGVPLDVVDGFEGQADLMRSVLSAIGVNGPVHVLGISAALMARPWSPDWSAVAAPTLAVASPVDKDVPVSHLDRLERALPHASALRVEAAGHFVWWGKQGKQVIAATLEHLARADEGRDQAATVR